MAEKLMMYYKYIGDKLGLEGKMKLAAATKVPSAKAAMEPDSEANIKMFRAALQTITGESPPCF